jgi:hypothetical protein
MLCSRMMGLLIDWLSVYLKQNWPWLWQFVPHESSCMNVILKQYLTPVIQKWTLLTNQLSRLIFRYYRSELQCHMHSSPNLRTMRPVNHCSFHPHFQIFQTPWNGNSIDSTKYEISDTYLTTETSQFLNHALFDATYVCY